MNGDLLALGMIGALALAGVKQRGSRAGSFNETVDRGELWHLVLTSGEPSQQRVFTPGIPKNPMPGQDVQVPRTSWSWTPEDAFIGTHWWGLKKVSTNLHIAAYTNTVAAQVYSPTKQQVPDVQDTTEVWTIQPTRATLAFVLSREDTRLPGRRLRLRDVRQSTGR